MASGGEVRALVLSAVLIPGCCRVCERWHGLEAAVCGEHVSYCVANSNTYEDAHPGLDCCPIVGASYGPSADTGTTSAGSCVQGSSAQQPLGI